MTMCSMSSMVPRRLLAGIARARSMLPGAAAASAPLPRTRRNVRRSTVVMEFRSLLEVRDLGAPRLWTGAVAIASQPGLESDKPRRQEEVRDSLGAPRPPPAPHQLSSEMFQSNGAANESMPRTFFRVAAGVTNSPHRA